jgi:glycosyltransferase involved in cell wall biosynthesis
MRRLCLRRSMPFTTSYHTRFPEYLAARAPPLLARLVTFAAYAVLRRFHAPAGAVMVATSSIERELRAHKFHRLQRWSRGVDHALFRPYGKNLSAYDNLPRPLLLYVGRVAVEKNLRAFLTLETSGSLIVIGDGPDLASLRTAYPQAHFLGAIRGEALARHYAAADLFVFPSTTDTFGLVLLEACASGLRIAACPAPGPSDIFSEASCGAFAALDDHLPTAVARALALPDAPDIPRSFSLGFSWESCTQQFLAHLQAPSPVAKRRLDRWRRKIGG